MSLPAAAVAGPAPALDPRRGVLLMLGGLGIFAVLNGVVKAQAELFPVSQIILFRNAFGILPLILIVVMMGGPRPRIRATPGHLWQTMFMSVTLVASYTAFARISLADTTAIFFLQPIILTLLAHLLLGERGGWRVWAATGLGFAGVLVVARPTGAVVDPGALFALAAAAFFAFAMLQQRALSARDDSMTITLSYMALSTALFLPTVAVWWVWPTPAQAAGLAAMGLASGVAQWLIIRPFAYAEASTLAPVQYANLLGAIVVGFVWFGDVPTWTTLGGAGIVLLATLMALGRR